MGCLFSFAGHGIERDGKGFLIPSDAQLGDDVEFLEETALSLESFKSRVRSMRVAQAVLLIDACRTDPGTGPDQSRGDAGAPLSQKFVDGLIFDLKNRDVQAFAVLYAASVGQKAYEFAEKKQGYFTWALVEGLRGEAANKNGDVTLSGLVSYIQQVIPKRIALDLGPETQQHPFALIEGYRADELVLASPPKGPASPISLLGPPVAAPAAPPSPESPALGGAPLTSVQELLKSRYPETRVLADGSRKSRAILIVKQAGIKSYPASQGFFWPNYYKADDQVRQPWGMSYHGSDPLNMAEMRFIPVGQEVLIRRLTIKDAEVAFRLETFPNPFLAELQVRFEKRFLATRPFPDIQKIIEQVLALK